jgi:hypothetical protein
MAVMTIQATPHTLCKRLVAVNHCFGAQGGTARQPVRNVRRGRFGYLVNRPLLKVAIAVAISRQQ